jgi:protocatechuate 3,4-dioxygenase beta subunit
MSGHEVLKGYRRPLAGSQPEYSYPAYGSTQRRAPLQSAVAIPTTLSELTGPGWADLQLGPHAADMTAGHRGEPLGERMFVGGRVLDENARPVPGVLLELWQCNAAGRYLHAGDQHDAPLDPNFTGVGHVMTDSHGQYRFKTIKPGAYPWRNHHNAWRPQHIHFSLIGPSLGTRLVTQMYFPGDPLLDVDPIFHSVADAHARMRLVASLDWSLTQSEYALGYRFDIVLRGRKQTPWER